MNGDHDTATIMATIRYAFLTFPACWLGMKAAAALERPEIYGLVSGLAVVAAISSGEGNRYGHPAADVLKLIFKEDVVPIGANRVMHLVEELRADSSTTGKPAVMATFSPVSRRPRPKRPATQYSKFTQPISMCKTKPMPRHSPRPTWPRTARSPRRMTRNTPSSS